MRRRVTVPWVPVLSLLLAVFFAWSAAPAAQGTHKTALVTVVTGSDAAQKDLTNRDFIVREDKSPREVMAADLATETLSIAVLLDTTKPAIGNSWPVQDVRSALSTFVKTVQGASPDAEIALMEIAGAAVMRVDFTNKTADLDKAIQRIVPDQRIDSVMLEALSDASKRLLQKPGPRRAIVTIDFGSQDTSALNMIKKVPDDVHKAGVTLWAISLVGSVMYNAPAREAMLSAVAEANGGMRMHATAATGLETLLKQVANSLLSQYEVTFMTKQATPDPKKITMETTRGAKVLLSPWMR
jgi:hypothetical protein